MKGVPPWLLRISVAAAVVSLLAEFGFYAPDFTLNILHAVNIVVLAVFLFDVAAGSNKEPTWQRRLQRCWLEIIFIALILGLTVWNGFAHDNAGLIRSQIRVTQVYLVLKILLDAFRANQRIT